MQKQEKTLKKKLRGCPRAGCSNFAIIDKLYGVLPCEFHQREDEEIVLMRPPEFPTISQSNRVTTDRDTNGRDIIQPWTPSGKINPEFTKHYPKETEDYFTKEQLKKL